PDNTYVVTCYQYPQKELLKAAGISYITNVTPDMKMSDDLKAAVQYAGEEVELTVMFTGVKEADALEAIATSGGVMLSNRLTSMGYIHARLPKHNVVPLMQWYGVAYANVYREDIPLNIDEKAMTRGQLAAAPLSNGGYGLKGEGITIGVGDNVSGIYHVDLMDRIINYNTAAYTNHGVHINGIVGGAGIVDLRGEGMAPAATLTNHYFSDVLDATPEISSLYNVIVTNNSYSSVQGNCDNSGIYDVLSEGLDKLCNSNNTVLQVFAAANNGLYDCPPYPQGFATITGGYQPAKNNLVVASTDREYVNADNSSRGPVRDGRLKPEISAVGVNVNSTTRHDEYLVASGTSMACPQVAGAAALLAQRMKQLSGITKPRADLLKTLLINGATDIGNEGPDYRFGFGFLNVQRSLIMLDSNRYATGNISTGGEQTYDVVVPPGVAQLKVLLCWHDAPATPMAAKVLVNDIDLEVAEPGNKVHQPLVLDATPANINNPGVEKEDRLNNCEQVVIDDPGPGKYTIRVKGFSVPTGSQDYVIAYDFIPAGIAFKYPLTASAVKAGDSMCIYWDASNGNSTFTLEYSENTGGVWNMIDNNIPAGQLHYKWAVPAGINSGKCLMRLTRGAEQATSEMFIISTQPDVKLSSVQCPGYIQIEWSAIPNATGYVVMRKAGPVMAVVDTVTITNYVFSGLDPDSTYYVAVSPVIDGLAGYRNVAVKRTPKDGSCSGNISDGDLMIEKVTAPLTGRKLTGTELTAAELLTVRVRNLDDAPCNTYKLSYSINGGPWVPQSMATPVAANSATSVSILGLDLSAEGDHHIRVAIENLTLADPVHSNDSFDYYVSQLPNPSVTLDYYDGFESLPVFRSIKDTFGLSTDRRWDFEKTTDTGQLRSFVLNSVLISGQRSLSLDAYKNCPGNFNALTGTFNLANYDANKDEVRLEFDYIIHGVPKFEPGNEVVARGKDTKEFQPIYTYEMGLGDVGKVLNSGSISLSDLVLNTGDNFSSSTQVQFGQNDISNIGALKAGSGMTLDNVRLYTVQNDVQLLAVVLPTQLSCGITGPSPLTIRIRNGVNIEQKNISLHYRLDNGSVVSESLSSLAGKQTLDFTFSNLLDISASGEHQLDIWLSANGDTYRKNDSVLDYKVRNQPLVSTYPYFEDFESGDGYWYTGGINSSWAHGTPSAPKISAAYSGKKAWVTNLSGNYNDKENSYLYSPCFDISGMEHPTFSSRIAVDIENCDFVLCDEAHLEFTTDGDKWLRVGAYGEGTNWYTDSNYQAWNVLDNTTWHQAEIALPDSVGNIQLRYVFHSDEGASFEGLAIDDIRIYDLKLYTPDNSIISISPNPTDNGIVNIEWAAHNGTDMHLVMTDAMGRTVYQSTATAGNEGYNKTTLQTPLYASGMYFMRIVIGDREHKRKIVYRSR
ncbi:MAG: S8 family serine peptidase, partial [Chitinophagaceae bacterium]|nr:S8 family serine peptidase [Chitinophagaceae bacterium]